MEGDLEKKTAHKARNAGRKAEKKKEKSKKGQQAQDLTAQQRNPKAFAFQSAVKARKTFIRSQDIKSKKHHIPVVDRTPLEPPPIIVAVVGGPKVGKTTLLRCLIRNYSKQKLTTISGPVTVVTGKKQRLSFIEVNNDINCMIDIAKVADIVLMLIDATFGIEMEVFEFLEICRAHGSPRIMGVLNHLDMLKDNKALKKKKKLLKHRFQVELYPGAKLFYLSGIIHGEYLKNEISNLGRFISVMKFRPLAFRSTHPYVLVDRWEDITNPEVVRLTPKEDRTIVLYGYVRGAPFKQTQNIHIPGCGDFEARNISMIPDPCPLPGQLKKRSLNSKERCMYAPMSGVAGVLFDKDAVYIDLGGSHHGKSGGNSDKIEANKKNILDPLLQLRTTTDQKTQDTKFQVFADNEMKENKGGKDIEENTKRRVLPKFETVEDSNGRIRRRAVWDDDKEDNEDSEEESSDDEDYLNLDEVNTDDDSDEEHEYASKRKRTKLNMEKSTDENKSDDSDIDVDEELKRISSQRENNGSSSSKLEQKSSSVPKPKSSADENQVFDRVQLLLNSFKQASKIKNQEKMELSDEESSDSDDDSDESSKKESKKNLEDEDLSADDYKESQESSKDGDETSKKKGKSNSEKKIAFNNEDNLDEDSFCDMEHYGVGDSSKITPDSPPTTDDEGSGEDEEYAEIDIFDRRKDIKSEKEGEDLNQENEEDMNTYRMGMFKEASNIFFRNQSEISTLRRYVYGEESCFEGEKKQVSEAPKHVGGLFTAVTKDGNEEDSLDHERVSYSKICNWDDPQVCEDIRDCFVTGKWAENESAQELLKLDDEDDEIYGDFEDLETGAVVKGGKKETKDEKKEEKEGVPKVEEEEIEKKPLSLKEKRMEKKRRLKEMFDSEYDSKGDGDHFETLKKEMGSQAQLNRSEFEGLDEETRVKYEGFRAGLYVRMEIHNMPVEFSENFDATYPVVVGGLLDNEQAMGYIRARIKVHRWYPRILKNRDPLIMSIGWRRFQSLMFYSKREDNFRLRSLKYARKFLHVEAQFWGPISPITQGFVALQNISDRVPDFRIAANGVVLETDQSSQIVKKLKLVGYPEKILNKTAFIKDMFHSDTEVVKFEGVKIMTQSGIRGIIKKSHHKDGVFRATFEDTIKMSDVIVLKAWAPVEVVPFCSYIKSLLLPTQEKEKWQGMRTVGQVKKAKNMRNNVHTDNLYTEIVERREYVPMPLSIPKQLQKALPYKSKPKLMTKKKKVERVFVVKDPEEVKMDQFMRRLQTLAKAKRIKEKKDKMQRKVKHIKDTKANDILRMGREKKQKSYACKLVTQKSFKKKKS